MHIYCRKLGKYKKAEEKRKQLVIVLSEKVTMFFDVYIKKIMIILYIQNYTDLNIYFVHMKVIYMLWIKLENYQSKK